VDNFVKDWTEEELTTYLITDTHRSENVEALLGSEAKQPEPEIEEKIVMKPKVEVAEVVLPQQVIAQTSEINIIEEDTTFDSEESDFVETDETDETNDVDFD
jgi:hypothetical protein